MYPCFKALSQSDCSLSDLPLMIYSCSSFSVLNTQKTKQMVRKLQKTDKQHKSTWFRIEWNFSTHKTGVNQMYLWPVLWWFCTPYTAVTLGVTTSYDQPRLQNSQWSLVVLWRLLTIVRWSAAVLGVFWMFWGPLYDQLMHAPNISHLLLPPKV